MDYSHGHLTIKAYGQIHALSPYNVWGEGLLGMQITKRSFWLGEVVLGISHRFSEPLTKTLLSFGSCGLQAIVQHAYVLVQP